MTMAAPRVERRLAAILAADVVGYSRLMEQDEQGTLERLKAHRKEFIEPLIAEYQGRIVKLMGDGALAEFTSVVDAVRCAVLIQQRMAEHELEMPEAKRIRVRIGINLGDVIREADGDLYGDGVNIAARLEQLAEPGGVVVSGTAYDHLQGKLDVPLEFTGEQRVKNIERLVRTYRIRLDGTAGRSKLPFPLRRARRFALPMIAALLLVLAVSVGAWWWFGSPATSGKPSIAVLPFDNLSGDDATGRLADGITEDIITDLARFPEFEVVARN
jgi:class 3 adenylate cyclase